MVDGMGYMELGIGPRPGAKVCSKHSPNKNKKQMTEEVATANCNRRIHK